MIGVRTRWLALGLLAGLVILLPMRAALSLAGMAANGLTARSVFGTVWSGELDDARFGDVALGSLRAGLSPLYLLGGQMRFAVRGIAPDTEDPIDGAIVTGVGGTGIVAMHGVLPVGQVFAPLPITAVALDNATIRFRDHRCAEAAGRIEARLGRAIDAVPGLALPRAVSGEAHCADGALLLPLTSQSGTEALTLSITGDGRYQARLSLQPGDEALAEKLRLAGFVPTPRGYQLSVEGHF